MFTKISDLVCSKDMFLIVAIIVWFTGFVLLPKDADRYYWYLYCAPLFTWVSAEAVALMMGEKKYSELKPTIIVNTHIAALLWFLNTSATTLSSVLFSVGCLLAIIWGGESEKQ
jgi:hypothetical protein